MTRLHPDVPEELRGTYLGLAQRPVIGHLLELGVTAVELMPVHEFPILDIYGNKPERPNYWGYDPMAFFAPHRGYAASDDPGRHVIEFKEMVKALHQADIEVILVTGYATVENAVAALAEQAQRFAADPPRRLIFTNRGCAEHFPVISGAKDPTPFGMPSSRSTCRPGPSR